MFLVGVDVLGDPLRQKFDTQKAKRYPDRFFQGLSGLMLFLDIKETRNKYMRVIQFDSGIDMVFNL